MSTNDFKEMHWMASVIGNIDVGMVVLDRDYKICAFNGFMEHHSNVHYRDAMGQELFHLFPEIPQQWFRQKVESVLLLKNMAFTTWEQRPYIFKFKNYRPITGMQEFMFQNMTIIPLTSLTGKVEQISLIIYDVTDMASNSIALQGANSQLKELNRIDALTQLNNRGAIEEYIAREFNRYQRNQSPTSLVVFDIDHFKRVNDTYGHPIGDEVLKEVASLLKTTQRDSDLTGRYGGEEFICLLIDTAADQAENFCERLRNNIAEVVHKHHAQSFNITISLGIAELAPKMKSYQQWITHADQALYQAKNAGRNQTVTFQPGK